jgi:nucleotide-binding universal stress UspA family protein
MNQVLSHDPIRRILVATDFSENAGVALGWATRLANAHGASIEVLHVVDAIATTSGPLETQEQVTRRLSQTGHPAGISGPGHRRGGRGNRSRARSGAR